MATPRIPTDMRKLKTLLKEVPDERKPIANSLFNELVFMQKTLEGLKKQVEEDGAVSMFKQRKQQFLREHPALKAYNTTIQRYSLLYKQLVELLPEPKKADSDGLLDFINSD